MSIKTLRKRIALVAVSALGVGLLSVAPASAAADSDGDIDAILNTGLVGAVTPSLTDDDNGATTRTAVLLSTGSISISLNGTGVTKVSSGAIISSQHGSTVVTAPNASSSINASQNCGITVAADYNVIRPIGAAGSTFTITTYDEDTCAGAATVSDVITVTIASSNLSGTPSAANSSVRWVSSNSATSTAAEDVTYSSTTFGNTLKLRINVKDVYDQDISAATGALVVTLTGAGGYLGTLAGSGSATAATAAATTQVSSSDPSPLWIVVSEATAGAGWSGTVSVTYNGVLLATKSGKITGAPASIALSSLRIGRTGTTSDRDTLTYVVKDSAGNALAFNGANFALDTSSNSAVLSGIADGAVDAAADSAYGAYVGGLKTICAGTAGLPNSAGNSADIVIKYTLSNGSVIKSNSVKSMCTGDAYEYSASFDKASYIQGEVATLTVSFKDAAGNPANSMTAVAALDAASTAGSTDASISAPMMAMVGSMAVGTSTKPNSAGNVVYTFTVGTASGLTPGAYNAVVNFPTVDVATSAKYQVSTGVTGVSNAEVLAAIVKLIASINKQIRALQKSLRR